MPKLAPPSDAGARSIAPRELPEIAQSNALRSTRRKLKGDATPLGLKMFSDANPG